MTDKPENPPAFPGVALPRHSGMTLRDWFAGQALGAMKLSSSGVSAEPASVLASEAVRCAYAYADLMLRERGL